MITFLSVLKIIGTVLLWILFIVLILVLLILFCPIHYHVQAVLNDPEGSSRKPDKDTIQQNLTGMVHFHWLLHIVRGGISYPDEKEFIIHILFFRLNITQRIHRRKDMAEKNRQPDNEAQKALEREREQDGGKDKGRCDGHGKEEAADHVKERAEDSAQETDAAPGRANPGRLRRFIRALGQALRDPIGFMECKVDALCARIKKAVSDIRWILKLLENDSTHRAADTLLHKGMKLLSAVLPRRWYVQGTIGLGDPEKEGQLLEVIGALYPLIGCHTDILPEFDLYRFDFSADAKGRIYIFRVLILVLQILLNRDVKRLRRRIQVHRQAAAGQN